MAEQTAGFMDRHHFLLRRLHSLTGIVPVGVFVIFHLFTNAQLVIGDFQHEVAWIHSLPALLIMEIGLWVAIAFHAGLGLAYTFIGARPNVGSYRYEGNWRYFFQRVTGIIALVFIFFHIATLRWGWDIAGWHTPFALQGATADQPLAQASTALALQAHWLIPVFYALGSLAVIYHWSNGLWTAAITWGMTLSVRAMRRWGGVCTAMGVVLTIFFGLALYGGLTYEVTEEERQWLQQVIEEVEQEAEPQADDPADEAVSLHPLPPGGGWGEGIRDNPASPIAQTCGRGTGGQPASGTHAAPFPAPGATDKAVPGLVSASGHTGPLGRITLTSSAPRHHSACQWHPAMGLCTDLTHPAMTRSVNA